jgi:hypothetical protein
MPPDTRIDNLTREIDRLRSIHDQTDTKQHELMLRLTEIQLNLAMQDKTLNKLDVSVNGNGRPGLVTRVDRIEIVIRNLTRAVWMLITTTVGAAFKFVLDRLHQ